MSQRVEDLSVPFSCSSEEWYKFLRSLNPDRERVLKQILAIGHLKEITTEGKVQLDRLRELLDRLIPVDAFYREMGGLLGYHEKVLALLKEKKEGHEGGSVFYHAPSFIDISQEEAVQDPIEWGIDALADMIEIYPLGGAADRLHLIDPETGLELPAAKLVFAGKTLLERLIRDLQAREALYLKKHGKLCITPIAIMTSPEKENHRHVMEIIESHRWFGRPKESFFFFTQPLVPVVTQEGRWCLSSPYKLLMKPGGHGAIWKLARDSGTFAWARQWNRKKALLRQINNLVAGLDYGLLAFCGIGWKQEMKFGFASCPRVLKAAEGVNVLVEKVQGSRRTVVLTNVEYCDFTKFGIEDLPLKEGEPYSKFSSNTNLLFADLDSLEKAVDTCPFPGLLINMKKGAFFDVQGAKREELVGRLESTMQNIADVFVEEKGEGLATKHTFITYNHRHKTISSTKKAYTKGGSLLETPENCFFEYQLAARELLEKHCHLRLPQMRSLLEALDQGPEFVFLYHPALGPLYSLIGQKVQGGSMQVGSELRLEIVNLSMRDLHLQGSCCIDAERPLGHIDERGILHYSEQAGKCTFKNVTVRNQGVDWESSRPFWKGDYQRKECLQIILHGNAEFVAEEVTLEGDLCIEVEEGTRLFVKQGEDGPVFYQECIE